MRFDHTANFRREFAILPPEIQRKFRKQAIYLLDNIQYPSLHAKKFHEGEGIWQARVDKHYRFYFQIDGDRYVLLNIRPHKD